MKSNENILSTTKAPLTSSTFSMASQDNTTDLENILLKMIYRISQEEMHVPDNVGSAA